MSYKIILGPLLFFLTFSVFASNCIEEFYVLDVGSSTTKGFFYTVNSCTKTFISEQRHNINYSYQNCINHHQDYHAQNECILKGVDIMSEMQKHFNINCTQKYCYAFATAWARNSINIESWIDKVNREGINAIVLNQSQEGEINFKACKSIINNYPLVVFDVGGASFQIIWEDKNVISQHHGLYGSDNYYHFIKNQFNLKNRMLSRQQIKDAMRLTKDLIGSSIKNDLNLQKYLLQKPIVVSNSLLFVLGIKEQLTINKLYIDKKELKNIIYKLCSLDKQQIKNIYPLLPETCLETTQTAMILIYTVMDSLNIDRIDILPTDHMKDFILTKI